MRLHAQALERCFGHALDLLRPAVWTHRRARALDGIMFPPKLGGDDHLPAKWLQCFTHQLLVGERPVHFRRVEKGDPALDRRAQEGDHLLFVGRPVAIAHAHAAQPESRDFQPAFSKFSGLHSQIPFISNKQIGYSGSTSFKHRIAFNARG